MVGSKPVEKPRLWVQLESELIDIILNVDIGTQSKVYKGKREMISMLMHSKEI